MLTQVIEGRDPNILTIEFMLGNVCNYKCSYCFPGSHEGTHPWPDTDLLLKNTSHLFEVYKKQGKTKFELYLIGGEPTLWKDLPRFCRTLKSNYDVIIRISTNGYRKPDWWKENSKLFDAVEISVHHEFADPDHIIAVGDTLYKQKTNLVTNVMMDPRQFDKCVSILEHLKTSKKRWPIIAKWLHFENPEIRYTEKQKSYLEKPLKRWPNLIWWFSLDYHSEYKTWVVEDGKKKRVADNYMMLNEKNKFKDWSCNLGLDHINIFKTGRIGGNCEQLIYGENFHYNLYDPNFAEKFNPRLGPVICTKEVCPCGFETNISKVIRIQPIQ